MKEASTQSSNRLTRFQNPQQQESKEVRVHVGLSVRIRIILFLVSQLCCPALETLGSNNFQVPDITHAHAYCNMPMHTFLHSIRNKTKARSRIVLIANGKKVDTQWRRHLVGKASSRRPQLHLFFKHRPWEICAIVLDHSNELVTKLELELLSSLDACKP